MYIRLRQLLCLSLEGTSYPDRKSNARKGTRSVLPIVGVSGKSEREKELFDFFTSYLYLYEYISASDIHKELIDANICCS
jgi:hypothetical protein